MERAILGVLFDATGTLFELRESVGETYARLARPHGPGLPAGRLDEAFHRVIGAAPPVSFPEVPSVERDALERGWWRQRVRETFRAADQTARFHDFDAAFEALFAHYAGAAGWRCVPGAEALLARCRGAQLRVGVASNFDHRLEAILADLGLSEGVQACARPGLLGLAKPDPRFFVAAAETLGLDPATLAYVGDDPPDTLAAAQSVGLRTVAIGTPASLGDVWNQLAGAIGKPRRGAAAPGTKGGT